MRPAILAALVAWPALAAEVAAPERLRGVDPAALGYTYAVGTFAPEYAAPAVGSYTLPVIQTRCSTTAAAGRRCSPCSVAR